MAFRVLDQSPQFFTADGSALLVGGSVTFYASGTSSLQDTFTDPSCTTANNNPLIINSQGRVADIWGNSNYRMIVKDALGAIQWTEDNVLGPVALPDVAGKSGQFLSNNGSNPLWSPVAVLPDVTGQAGNMLVNNGTAAYWTPQPVPPTPSTNPDITVTNSTAGRIVIGTVTIQWGTGTLPASGGNTTNVAVSFGTAFSSSPYHVDICAIASSGVTSSGGMLILSAPARTTTGFNAWGDTNAGFASGSHPITSTTPFTWHAIGPT